MSTKKNMKRRAYALEAALDAMARAGRVSGAERIELDPDNVLRYAKFILGKRSPSKRKRRKAQGGERRAYWAEKGTPLPSSLEDLEAKGWKPLGYLTEDGLKEDPAFSVADAFRRDARPDLAVPAIAGATLEKFAERIRDGEEEGQSAPIGADPEPDATSGQPVGEDPGDREVLTQWAETIRQQDAAREAALEARDLEVDPEDEEVDASLLKPLPPAEKALREDLSATWAPRRHVPEWSTNAPDHVVRQGKLLGCPECSAEAERRKKRDEALKRGREKLRDRLTTLEQRNTDRVDQLDEDELLAVAGEELYPAMDEEPSRELKIRNRKGEVRSYVRRSGAAGWTLAPLDGWSLRLAWTSSEMVRRGPWHIV